MTAINVTRIAQDIYRLDLSLEKPQPRDVPVFEQPYFFTEKRRYYFWYQNGTQIIFKVGNRKVTIPTGRKDVLRVDIHSPDTYSIDRETMLAGGATPGPLTAVQYAQATKALVEAGILSSPPAFEDFHADCR